MSELSRRRRRVVVLCSGVAAMSGSFVLLKDHPVARIAWIVMVVAILIYAVAELAKLKREEHE